MKKRITVLWCALGIIAAIHLTNRFTHIEENLMAIAESTLDFITKEEGKRNKAYRDSRGLWTVGIGHLIKPGEEHLIGKTLSDDEVKDLLRADLKWCSEAVESSVRVSLPQSSMDALYSICYNIGGTAFKNSTLVKKLNAGDIKGAADQFLVWSKQPELLPRRKRERALFLSEI